VYVLQVHIFLVKVIVLGRYLFVYKFYNSLLQLFLDGFGHVWLWILKGLVKKDQWIFILQDFRFYCHNSNNC